MLKRTLYYISLIVALCSTLLTTACESEEFLYHEETYNITRYKTNCNMAYEEPNRRSEQAMGLYPDIEVYVQDTVQNGNEMWVEIFVPSYDTGWVPSGWITPFEGTRTDRVRNTPTEVMEAAGQPISKKIAEFYEYTHTLYDSTDILVWLNMAIILLVWFQFLVIWYSEYAGRWWEYIIMFIAGALAIGMWLTSDLFEDGCSFDIWWLDLIFGLLAIALPVAYWLNTSTLLNYALEDVFDEPEHWTKYHLIATVVGFIVLGVCFWWWKSVLDWVIIGNVVLQAISLLVLLVICIINRSFMRFFWYVICFVLMVIPALIMSSISFAMVAALVAMFLVFITPFAKRGSLGKVVGYDVFDQYGNKIDTTDESGHSTTTGRDYTV